MRRSAIIQHSSMQPVTQRESPQVAFLHEPFPDVLLRAVVQLECEVGFSRLEPQPQRGHSDTCNTRSICERVLCTHARAHACTHTRARGHTHTHTHTELSRKRWNSQDERAVTTDRPIPPEPLHPDTLSGNPWSLVSPSRQRTQLIGLSANSRKVSD